MTAICSICIRGGSKGVPAKNIRDMLGKPLFVHSVDQARATGRFALVAVSSDDERILDLARRHGVDAVVRRPDEMATDAAPKGAAIRHCVEQTESQSGLRFDTMVDLDATSPLREPADIAGAMDLLGQSGADNVITGAPARRSPYFNLVEEDADGWVSLSKKLDRPIARRQDAPRCFDMNASIYVWTREAFFSGPGAFTPRTRLFEMPEERSVDIDSPLDWKVVEMLLRERTATP